MINKENLKKKLGNYIINLLFLDKFYRMNKKNGLFKNDSLYIKLKKSDTPMYIAGTADSTFNKLLEYINISKNDKNADKFKITKMIDDYSISLIVLNQIYEKKNDKIGGIYDAFTIPYELMKNSSNEKYLKEKIDIEYNILVEFINKLIYS